MKTFDNNVYLLEIKQEIDSTKELYQNSEPETEREQILSMALKRMVEDATYLYNRLKSAEKFARNCIKIKEKK